MLRLYLRFYIALLASLALLGLAASVLVHFAGGPMEQVGVTVGRLVQNVLPPAQAPASEQQQALQRLAAGLKADVTLFAEDGMTIAAIRRPLPMTSARHYHPLSFGHWQGNTLSSVPLAHGRLLFASVPIGFGATRLNFHLLVIFAALAIGVAAFPIVRPLTGRLERPPRRFDPLRAG